MPTTRRYRRHAPRVPLSEGQAQELWLGPDPRFGSRFSSREHLAAVWRVHGHKIMARWANRGRRPAGWWEFETDLPRPDYDVERSTLWSAGLLRAEEKAELEAEWRAEFERAQRPAFFLCTAPNCIYHGAAARRRHYAWADIPKPLVDEWTRERRRGEDVKQPSEPADVAAFVGSVTPLSDALTLRDTASTGR